MTIKPVLWEDLVHYDEKIKEYIEDNASGIIEGSGIEIYNDYSKLPNNLTEKTIAYCENDYINGSITHSKGLYFYDKTTWEIIYSNDSSDNGNCILEYEDYSKLPMSNVEVKFAYCKNNYVDDTDADNPIIYSQGFYYYNGTTWELIANGTVSSNGIEIYEDYSKLPFTNVEDKTIAYCCNQYVDTTNVDYTINYNKGLYYYNINDSKWLYMGIDADLSEYILEILNKKVAKIELCDKLNDYLDKTTYASEVDVSSVKLADKAKSLEGTELAKPHQFWGIDSQGEARYQYVPINNTEDTQNFNYEQYEILNAVQNDIYSIETINSLDDRRFFIQAYKTKPNDQDIIGTIMNFSKKNENRFYFNDDSFEFGDSSCGIKKFHTYKVSLNSDDFYESAIIKSKDYLEIVEIIQR